MEIAGHDKYERFRHILREPWDKVENGKFPLFTTDTPFRIKDYQNESANISNGLFDHMVKALPKELFLDLGCGRRNEKFDNCLYLEVYPSISADIIVDADCTYPIKDNTLAGIGCFAVLEHVRKPWLVVREIRRMLKPGGRAFIDWPFLQPVHGYPSHYFNATREGLVSIFEDEGFTVLNALTGEHQTPAYSLWWMMNRFAHHVGDDRLRAEFLSLRLVDLVTKDPRDPLWLKFMAAFPPEAMSELACGNFLVADKEGGPLEFKL